MRNVTRTPKPDSLRHNAAKWTREIVRASAAAKRRGIPVPRGLYRYNRPDIREGLEEMYKGLCCYCEARVGHVAFKHIEHRRPKSRFPSKTYQWNNLNLACPKCNNAKGEKWRSRESILDAADKLPIDEHLTYKVGESGVRRWPLSERGETTVDHADLDRVELVEQRNRLYMKINGLIDEISKAKKSRSPELRALIRELKAKIGGEYGSLIQWMIERRAHDIEDAA